MRHIAIIILTTLIISCDRTEHRDFISISDCLVYDDEVITEPISHGHVEYIDPAKALGCIKEQLSNAYLLYYDTIHIAVYNQHPKDNFKLIESLIKNYQTDTTRLSRFVHFDSSINITVTRLCKDKTNETYYNEYADWRDMEYSTITKPFTKTKDELITTWYKWTE
ncbi:hypothetical protein [Niastella sp. OAS944]|uniref:hypothetical protein n=1 Tax=Niastella sp. OAS944 TaxID=2664089 RepID=UPI00348E57F1|nr:hypothetical protein [Chitinophagaceae bacterium OAS944]